MSLRTLFESLKPRWSGRLAVARRDGPRRRPTARLRLEALEDRFLPSAYVQTNLAADQPGVAQVHDPELIDAWGISLNPVGTFWVSARATDVSTVYTGDVTQPNGTISPFVKNQLTVTIPGGAPTGQVFNPPTVPPDFVVSAGGASARAVFIFASETGHITGWNPGVPPPPPAPPSRNAQPAATTPDAVYTGLAIGNNGTGNFLYAADFKNGEIDVFDRTYKPTTLTGSFVDPNIPEDYSPFNIWNLGGKLYVTYARQDDGDALPDGGHGFISVFDTNGNLLNHLVADSHLKEPWGLALAPANFGEFSNALLVANTANGKINAYDATTGAFLGRLADVNGEAIHIEGLWALHFGNGTASGDRNALYFSASGKNHQHGLFGSLRLAPEVESLSANEGVAQRSKVNGPAVTSSDIVALDPTAFDLHRPDRSLADGSYALTIRSDLVHDAAGRAINRDSDGQAEGDRIDAFFRRYGDSDGDRDADLHDLGRVLNADDLLALNGELETRLGP